VITPPLKPLSFVGSFYGGESEIPPLKMRRKLAIDYFATHHFERGFC
jgi:hypothetical protein